MYQKPKGTRDIFAPEIFTWQKVENVAKEVAHLFGCTEFRTPVFEDASLYLRSVGQGTDIVNKEMYIFKDKADRTLALRPEGTAGVVRAFVEDGLSNEMLPQKYYYIANNFRYENPQAGRYRQHTQFGVEMFGIDSPLGEVETLCLMKTFFEKVGITDLTLKINSIGCPECRAKFNQALKDYAQKNEDKLCEDCKHRKEINPLRMLDCKKENCKKVFADAPTLSDYLCESCRSHFETVKKLLKENDISFVEDKNLVRGFDYYTKTVFEFEKTNFENTGKPLAVGGGGRYDNLVEEIGGKKTSCIGFGIGLDRLIALLPEEKMSVADVVVMNAGKVLPEEISFLVQYLRQNGISSEGNLANRSFKNQFKFADKLCAKYVCIVGENELKTGNFTLKNLKSGEEEKLSKEDMVKKLQKYLCG